MKKHLFSALLIVMTAIAILDLHAQTTGTPAPITDTTRGTNVSTEVVAELKGYRAQIASQSTQITTLQNQANANATAAADDAAARAQVTTLTGQLATANQTISGYQSALTAINVSLTNPQ